MENAIPKLSELKKTFSKTQNTYELHKSRLSKLDKLALFVTEKIGTMGFFFIIFVWTILWLSWNIFGPKGLQFDPFPAFVLWLFISNLIQLHLMPLLLIGQNLQGKHSEIRADHDYKTNIKAEREIETVILHLEEQARILRKLEKQIEQIAQKKA